MITANKRLLSRTADEVRGTVEHLDCGWEHLDYLAGAWLRELAVKLATGDGLTVSAVMLRLTPAIPSVLQSACL